MYRFMNYKILMLASCAFLSACGQSGALQLPNDQNHDKRAKYLLYSDAEAPQKSAKHTEQAPVQPPAAPEDSTSTTTP
ncbi:MULTISPECIES: lipoprotein [Acinetobacter]|jgi:predicted small lipoprotein YifL|uniref:Lipoprotein n=2 Tax=Acinetobacter entericus TaxID=2989714 RepID=A0ABT3NHC4_9GAMM|nr:MULTISPECIES: lipoprotein [Acinetobacter]MCW8038950.1 lipoprotein [Acinetobacter entericus]